MQARTPQLTIGLPVYNGAKYLAQAIDAHLAQTFTDFELIISDNGSTDETESICRAYAAKDERIRYERQAENRGATWNFNRVFELGRAPYFKWSAYDDLIEPAYLARCIAALEANSTAVLCHTATRCIDANGRVVRDRPKAKHRDSVLPSQRFGETIANVTFENVFSVMRRDWLARTGLIRSYANCDVVLLCELSLYGRLIELDEPLFLSRDHAANSVRSALSPSDRGSWFDPKLAGRAVFPICRETCEYFRAIHRARLPLRQRLACYGHVLRWAKWNAGRIVLDVRRGMKQVVASRRVQPA